MKRLIIILLCLACIPVVAQKSQADNKFKLYEYSEAIPLYQHYLEKSPNDYDALKNLALSYKYTNNISGAIESYRSMLKLKETVPEDLYDIVQLLRINGNLAEARLYAVQYQVKMRSEKSSNLLKSIDMYGELMSEKDFYEVERKTMNYPKSIFSPVFYQDGFIVTAESMVGNENEWTGREFTKLYKTDLNFSQHIPFASEVMSDYNDGPAVLSKEGNLLYLTTVNKESLVEQDVNTRKLQISLAIYTDGRWVHSDIQSFKDPRYNYAHPALSGDGKMLVFSSDMPGGKGKMDLYYCLKQSGNTWSAPINISALNSTENEIFPTLDASGNLYFASNGLPGLGGLDVFKSKFEMNLFSEPVNLKAPINSNFDDFALITNDNQETGYLSTNRFESTETDDIAFFFRKEPAVKPIVKIHVVDKYTSIPLPYVTVSFKDETNDVIYSGMTDPNGLVIVEDLNAEIYKIQGILNNITTTTATILKDEFSNLVIEKTITHNDPRFTLSGVVVNSVDGNPVPDVTVTCMNTTSNKSSQVLTQNDGNFFFQLEQTSDFKVFGEKPGWLSSETAYETTKGLDRTKELYVVLKLDMQQPTGEAVIKLDKIFYDFDKCNINPRAAEELNRLVKLMNEYPDMIIELSSHTDSRGSDAYNEKLSQCRADAAVSYILSKGISSNRLTAKGYGEGKPVNECGNGVDCTEEKHQENRRTEFRIVSCPSCPAIGK